MAETPIVDLSAIDLTAVAVTPEEVGRLNAQCGPMRQLDHVIWFSDDDRRALGVKHLTNDEFWIPYHIPGRPLMPGVLMIEAGAQLASVHYRRLTAPESFVGFIRCDDTVFRRQVEPGSTLYLAAEALSLNRRRFISKVQGIVDDQIVFHSKITGMAV